MRNACAKALLLQTHLHPILPEKPRHTVANANLLYSKKSLTFSESKPLHSLNLKHHNYG